MSSTSMAAAISVELILVPTRSSSARCSSSARTHLTKGESRLILSDILISLRQNGGNVATKTPVIAGIAGIFITVAAAWTYAQAPANPQLLFNMTLQNE